MVFLFSQLRCLSNSSVGREAEPFKLMASLSKLAATTLAATLFINSVKGSASLPVLPVRRKDRKDRKEELDKQPTNQPT